VDVDCEDALCITCVKAHKSSKSSTSHHVIDIDATSTLPGEVLTTQTKLLASPCGFKTFHQSIRIHKLIKITKYGQHVHMYVNIVQHHKTKHVRTTRKPVFGISFPHDNAISFICIRILTLPRLMCVVYDYIRS
jgi:hypothetical protein